MSSYSRNIERLRSGERRNVQQSTAQRTSMANITGNRQINEATDIAEKLSAFSTTLGEWKEKDIEKKQYEGKLAAREAREENAERLYELSQELETVKEQDTRYHEIKAEMLRLQGPSAYPDADRLAKLSPWAQVGYAQEKLRVFNDTYDSKLAHAMQNSEKSIKIQGISFTPKELHDNNISDPILKEAALQVIGNDIKKAAQLDRFSPEMRKLAGTSDAITKAKEGQLAKYRQRYNLESSANTRGKAVLEWKNSAKNGDDLYRYLLVHGATIDGKGNILGNTGAWTALDSQLVSEGIAAFDPEYAEKILNQPMPDALAAKLGAKKGTTFAQQWPNKAATLEGQIKDGIKKKVDAENDWLKAAGTDLENKFIERARKADLSEQDVREAERKFNQLGLTVPKAVQDYRTLSDRDEDDDIEKIKDLIASQKGYISHAQLDTFHPRAAAKYRDKATKLEKAALQEFGAEDKIEAALNTVFTGMGVKTNEKSLAWIESNEAAKADYAEKYNRYIAMDYRPKFAHYLALYGKPGEVKDPETNEPLVDEVGVITEIKQNLAENKYTKTGMNIEKELKPEQYRVRQVALAKEEIRDNRGILTQGTVGGDFGHRQITIIKNNLDKYGPKGLYMDPRAYSYYEGIARGRDESAYGIIDAQLKALGHEGLIPDNRTSLNTVTTGKDQDGVNVEDDDGVYNTFGGNAGRAFNYPSPMSTIYGMNYLRDGVFYGGGYSSIWDNPNNLIVGEV